jgi:hypothetical protein
MGSSDEEYIIYGVYSLQGEKSRFLGYSEWAVVSVGVENNLAGAPRKDSQPPKKEAPKKERRKIGNE